MTAKLISLKYAGTCAKCDEALPVGTRAWWDAEAHLTACQPVEARHLQLRVRRTLSLTRCPNYRSRGRWGWPVDRPAQSTKDCTRPARRGLTGSGDDSPVSSSSSPTIPNRPGHGPRVPRASAAWRLIFFVPSGTVPFFSMTGKFPARGGTSTTLRLPLPVYGLSTPRTTRGWSNGVTRAVGSRPITTSTSEDGTERRSLRASAGRSRQFVQPLGGVQVPIHAALCFIEADWNLFAKPFQLDGVWVTWAQKLAEMIAALGPMTPTDVTDVADGLARALPPAVRVT